MSAPLTFRRAVTTDRTPKKKKVVTGATGRVGSLAVRRVLELYPNVLVRAVVTDMAKGKRLLKEEIDKYGIKLEARRQQNHILPS